MVSGLLGATQVFTNEGNLKHLKHNTVISMIFPIVDCCCFVAILLSNVPGSETSKTINGGNKNSEIVEKLQD